MESHYIRKKLIQNSYWKNIKILQSEQEGYMGDELIWSVGRPKKVSETDFIREYRRFQDGKYGNISKKEFARLQGIPISTFNKYERSLIKFKCISKQEKKELKTLADDFKLLQREDVQEIIENCRSYAEGQQKIMRVYTSVYLS